MEKQKVMAVAVRASAQNLSERAMWLGGRLSYSKNWSTESFRKIG